jgi:hypothetical protein
MLTPLIYSLNSRHDNYCPIIVTDYPFLKSIENIIHKITLEELKAILASYIHNMKERNYSFSYEVAAEQFLLDHRLQYTAELLRQTCYSSKRVLLVVNHNYVDNLVTQWKNLDPKIVGINSFYEDYDKIEMKFIDYIEKLVIIDVLTGSFIKNNFIKNSTFPFRVKKDESWKVGTLNLFMLYNSMHQKYMGLFKNIPFKIQYYEEHLKKFILGINNEVDIDLEKDKYTKEIYEELMK